MKEKLGEFWGLAFINFGAFQASPILTWPRPVGLTELRPENVELVGGVGINQDHIQQCAGSHEVPWLYAHNAFAIAL